MVLLLAGAVALMAACDEPTAPKLFGVSLAQSGSEVELHYVTCPKKAPGKEIDAIRVVERHGSDPWDGDDPALWEVRALSDGGIVQESPEISDVESYVVGRTPPGFREAVALVEPLPPEGELVAQIETSFSSVAVGFQTKDLSSTLIANGDSERLEPDEFEKRASDANCQPLRPLMPPRLFGLLLALALIAIVFFLRRKAA